MKERYLEELKILLGEYSISQEELDDIIADYGEMIDDAISKNMSIEKILELIGTPKKVVEDLSEGFEKQDDEDDDDDDDEDDDSYTFEYQNHSSHKHIRLGNRKDNRIVALMPFISIIIFFILGLGFNLWHPGWMVFLLIPVVAIIINVFKKGKNHGLVALSPFFAIVTFFILGFGFDLWHPGWLVFLITPVVGVLSGRKRMKFIPLLTALSPFIALSAFILYGTYFGDWKVIWLVFLATPILGGLNYKGFWKVLLFEGSMAIAIGAYLYLGFVHDEWFLSLFAFLIPLGVSMLLSESEWSFTCDIHGELPEWLLLLACIIIYFGAGFIFGTTWSYLWMIFLSIPVLAILRHSSKDSKLVAVMPFISTVIFFSLGFFFSFWAFAWIAFLLIPMVAIIKNA